MNGNGIDSFVLTYARGRAAGQGRRLLEQRAVGLGTPGYWSGVRESDRKQQTPHAEGGRGDAHCTCVFMFHIRLLSVHVYTTHLIAHIHSLRLAP